MFDSFFDQSVFFFFFFFSSYVSTSLGSGSLICVWRSPRQLLLPLGFGLSSSAIILDLTRGIGQALFLSTTGTPPAIAVLAVATAAQVPQPPVVLLSGPSSIALCTSSYVISAQSSVALPLFTSPVFSWSASPTTPALAAAITASAGSSRLSVNALDLEAGVVYSVTASIGGVSTSHNFQLSTSTQVCLGTRL